MLSPILIWQLSYKTPSFAKIRTFIKLFAILKNYRKIEQNTQYETKWAVPRMDVYRSLSS